MSCCTRLMLREWLRVPWDGEGSDGRARTSLLTEREGRNGPDRNRCSTPLVTSLGRSAHVCIFVSSRLRPRFTPTPQPDGSGHAEHEHSGASATCSRRGGPKRSGIQPRVALRHTYSSCYTRRDVCAPQFWPTGII